MYYLVFCMFLMVYKRICSIPVLFTLLLLCHTATCPCGSSWKMCHWWLSDLVDLIVTKLSVIQLNQFSTFRCFEVLISGRRHFCKAWIHFKLSNSCQIAAHVWNFVPRSWTLSVRVSTSSCSALRTRWLWCEAGTDPPPRQRSPSTLTTWTRVPFCLRVTTRWPSERAKNRAGSSPPSEATTPTLTPSGELEEVPSQNLPSFTVLISRLPLRRYSLQGDTKKYFSIGKYSGELKTVQALDREENSTYTMEVIAVDGRTFFYEEKHYQNRFYSSRQ